MHYYTRNFWIFVCGRARVLKLWGEPRQSFKSIKRRKKILRQNQREKTPLGICYRIIRRRAVGHLCPAARRIFIIHPAAGFVNWQFVQKISPKTSRICHYWLLQSKGRCAILKTFQGERGNQREAHRRRRWGVMKSRPFPKEQEKIFKKVLTSRRKCATIRP